MSPLEYSAVGAVASAVGFAVIAMAALHLASKPLVRPTLQDHRDADAMEREPVRYADGRGYRTVRGGDGTVPTPPSGPSGVPPSRVFDLGPGHRDGPT